MKPCKFVPFLLIFKCLIFLGCGSEDLVNVRLSISVTPEGTGSVSPASATVTQGETLTLQANPKENFVFEKWEGAITGTSNPTSIVMDRDKAVTAVFKPKSFPLNIKIVGMGKAYESIVANPSGREYPEGTMVELTAEPSPNWYFKSWSGDLNAKMLKVRILVDEPKDVTVTFEELKDFIDIREGKSYKRVRINDQVWMAENLAFTTPNSRCYLDYPYMCADYGRYYFWEEALTACPEGWRLPTEADWQKLIAFAGGSPEALLKLLSKSVNGKDEFGWNGKYSGMGRNNGFSGGEFFGSTLFARYWTADGVEGNQVEAIAIVMRNNFVGKITDDKKKTMLPCRCIME